MRPTRPVSWLAPARKAFEGFPEGTREIIIDALQKNSTHGIKTPKHEIDLIKDRLKRLKEMLR